MTKPNEALREAAKKMSDDYFNSNEILEDFIPTHAHEYGIGMVDARPEQPARKMVRWEYNVQTIKLTELEKWLNVFALDGWELFSTVQDREVFWHILKRPIQEPTP